MIAPPSGGALPSDAVVTPSDAIVGFVVAGGQSRRMGRDKALLPWNGGTLLDHAVTRLRAVCRDVRVLSGADRRYADRGLPVDVDAIAEDRKSVV